jgi:hypothetical protein
MATGWSVCSGHEPWRPDRQNDASTVATSKRWVLDVGVEGGGGLMTATTREVGGSRHSVGATQAGEAGH